MRTDLLDAQAATDWAVSQIPLLQNAFLSWNQQPYRVVQEPDAERGGYKLVAHLGDVFPLTLNAWVGAIINSLRSSLDLLAAALARRNGKNPTADTHFPVFGSHQEMIDPLTGIKSKKWLSEIERSAIEALRPYQGGDDTIWPLHQLDIRRKHQRLIVAGPDVAGFLYQAHGPRGGYMRVGGMRGIERSEDKTILGRLDGEALAGFSAAKGYTHVAAFIAFDEPEAGLANAEVAETLLRFAARMTEIISGFR